ncbi:GH25 family lysozyme [Streptomyces pathocidini]|uniref:GH25 family lysozyme n=1 Tax=Streptomyces pathocidini TaxID=1650571 RepID=A0ABW7US28_9ACTN|nr:GH25 family lysozyme [Streptomyces pathocidini]
MKRKHGLLVAAAAAGVVTASFGGPAAAADRDGESGKSYMGIGNGQSKGPKDLPRSASTGPEGIDLSNFQRTVPWQALQDRGVKFAYAKSSEGSSYTDPMFQEHVDNAKKYGMLAGAYHFPNLWDGASPAAQADYFLQVSGGWKDDGTTLPGVLDLENVDGKPFCYNKSPEQMVAWIREFTDTYREKTGRDAVIYTRTNWWSQCTGNSAEFTDNPLWLSNWAATPGTMPAGWDEQAIWQYAGGAPGASDPVDRIDKNVFNGTEEQLKSFAAGEVPGGPGESPEPTQPPSPSGSPVPTEPAAPSGPPEPSGSPTQTGPAAPTDTGTPGNGGTTPSAGLGGGLADTGADIGYALPVGAALLLGGAAIHRRSRASAAKPE